MFGGWEWDDIRALWGAGINGLGGLSICPCLQMVSGSVCAQAHVVLDPGPSSPLLFSCPCHLSCCDKMAQSERLRHTDSSLFWRLEV